MKERVGIVAAAQTKYEASKKNLSYKKKKQNEDRNIIP